MAKRNTGGVKASKSEETRLKGLERRTRKGRRKTPRRKSDPNVDAEQAVAEPERLSLAGEADALVTHYYKELFSLCPEMLSMVRNEDVNDEHRKFTVALELVVDVLRRQDERVKVLKELELEYRDDVVQTHHYGAVAETLLDLIAEFSSDAWTGAIEQIRDAKDS